jgi:hypothetical protein
MKPRLFAERCATCVFRPGNLMSLQTGRLADLVAANRRTGSMLICHETLDEDVADVMCRGYFDAYAEESAVAQVMERLFGPEWYDEVEPS